MISWPFDFAWTVAAGLELSGKMISAEHSCGRSILYGSLAEAAVE